MSRQFTQDFLLEVNKGNVAGHSLIAVISSNVNVGTAYTDIWNGGGDMTYQTGVESWEIVCADSNDTAAGSGAREVTIVSMDVNGSSQVTVQATNGGTQAVSGTHYDIQSISVTDAGTVRGANTGAITLQVSGGGAIRSKILADGGNGNNSHYTVPLGFNAYWIEAYLSAVKGEDSMVRPLFQFGGVGAFFRGAESSTYQNYLLYPFKTFLALPEKSRILQQAKSTNSGVQVTSVNEFLLIDNTL